MSTENEVEAVERRRPGRPPLNRPPVRAEGEREPARAASERRRRRGANDDRFSLPGNPPEGSSYEWKRMSIYGQEDPFYIQAMRENGWEPVDSSRHPGWMPPGFKGAIIKDGMMLMERPQELTDEATSEMNAAARAQVRDQEAQLGMTGANEFVRRPQDVTVRREYHAPIAVDGE